MALAVKNLPAEAGDVRDRNSIPGSGRPPGGGHGNPPQYSCLENALVRGTWRAAVLRVAKSQMRLMQLSMHTSTLRCGVGGGAGGAQGHSVAVHWLFPLMHWLFMQAY